EDSGSPGATTPSRRARNAKARPGPGVWYVSCSFQQPIWNEHNKEVERSAADLERLPSPASLLLRWRPRMAVNHPPKLSFIPIEICCYCPQPENPVFLPYLDMLCHDCTDQALSPVHHN